MATKRQRLVRRTGVNLDFPNIELGAGIDRVSSLVLAENVLSRIDTVSTPNAPHTNDRVLVQRMLSGDSSAWQTFVQSHGRLVRSRVADVASTFGRSRDESAIDDATAEVFAALLSNNAAALRAFAGRSSLSTYVAVIATRSATRGFARRRLPLATPESQSLDESAHDNTTGDPVKELIDSEQQQRIRTLIQRLPDRQRDLIRLFHLEGQTYEQISQDLGVPVGSIGPTLRRAEAKLRQWLETE